MERSNYNGGGRSGGGGGRGRDGGGRAGGGRQGGGRGGGRFQSHYATQHQRDQFHGGGRGSAGGGSEGRQPPASFPAEAWKGTSSVQPPCDLSGKFSRLTVSEQEPLSLADNKERYLVMRRPDKGGRLAIRSVRLLVNHFRLQFDPSSTILHYNIDIKRDISSPNQPLKKIPKSDLRMIKEKLFSENPTQFPAEMSSYDGEKNVFSCVPLPAGKFDVKIFDNDERSARCYTFTIQFVNELKLSKLRNYLTGIITEIPREVIQGMDLVMKENPSRRQISIGRGYYSKEFCKEDDLYCGVAAHRGSQQSLKPTAQGMVLCKDYSVLAFCKKMPVLDFLVENIRGFNGARDVVRMRSHVVRALQGLKVTVTHRLTKQKYTINGLTSKNTRELTFTLDDLDGNEEPKEVSLVSYFMEKYGLDIQYKDIPCLDVGRGKRPNYIPMECCVLAEGQRYPKEQLEREAGALLKGMSLVAPNVRRRKICEMIRSEDGPCGGEVARNFGFDVCKTMTVATGRVIGPPELKLGNQKTERVDPKKCQWNLLGKTVVEGKSVERWALIDFSSNDRQNKLAPNRFIPELIRRCNNLGVCMDQPLLVRQSTMNDLSDIRRLSFLLRSIVDEAKARAQAKLQIVICVMPRKDPSYKYIKWVSETKIGVITQCCLSKTANNARDQDLANIALKINAKLGGSNVELIERLPHFNGSDHVMFIGADVNHPAPFNKMSPSIAAVVGSVTWPTVNRYAARVCPQAHRKEKIINFGSMCNELVNTYARLNGVKPKKIVVFRDGVSEGQFDMVLNEELYDMKNAFAGEHYFPAVTLVVAQKRHQTRLFLENERDGVSPGNVPPGTVVDTTITHPFEFDFYLCSHFGGLGTSKPTHYYVLRDENLFSSDNLQKLIYDLCFTFARCTKPVSLVPPVYYADLVAYRGWLFQEVEMEQHSPAFASSSSSVVASGALFDRSFYELHEELKDIMFFI